MRQLEHVWKASIHGSLSLWERVRVRVIGQRNRDISWCNLPSPPPAPLPKGEGRHPNTLVAAVQNNFAFCRGTP